jgi:hypothetical protein
MCLDYAAYLMFFMLLQILLALFGIQPLVMLNKTDVLPHKEMESVLRDLFAM